MRAAAVVVGSWPLEEQAVRAEAALGLRSQSRASLGLMELAAVVAGEVNLQRRVATAETAS
jgi:hypothetical protein